MIPKKSSDLHMPSYKPLVREHICIASGEKATVKPKLAAPGQKCDLETRCSNQSVWSKCIELPVFTPPTPPEIKPPVLKTPSPEIKLAEKKLLSSWSIQLQTSSPAPTPAQDSALTNAESADQKPAASSHHHLHHHQPCNQGQEWWVPPSEDPLHLLLQTLVVQLGLQEEECCKQERVWASVRQKCSFDERWQTGVVQWTGAQLPS
uniref:Uncharacterized protein n=1 Tax=Ditylenchus dipsaci TaxID=166011 RepID=A0A915E8E7_9BILA